MTQKTPKEYAQELYNENIDMCGGDESRAKRKSISDIKDCISLFKKENPNEISYLNQVKQHLQNL